MSLRAYIVLFLRLLCLYCFITLLQHVRGQSTLCCQINVYVVSISYRFRKRCHGLITMGCLSRQRSGVDGVIGSVRSVPCMRQLGPPTVSRLRRVSGVASRATKLLHDLFRPVIASVSTCGVQDSSDSPAPDTASRPLSYNSVHLPSVSMSRRVTLSGEAYDGDVLHGSSLHGKQRTTHQTTAVNHMAYFVSKIG